jgi:hypothetical protein
MIANRFFLPRHLLPHALTAEQSKLTLQRQAAAEEV